MKTIQLVKTKEPVIIGNRTQEIEINTLDLLETAINSPVKGGYNVSDMLIRIKLLDLIKETKASAEEPTSISFEDADFKALKQMVADTKWSILSKNILEFCQDIEKQ